jgi:hypothetical protein
MIKTYLTHNLFYLVAFCLIFFAIILGYIKQNQKNSLNRTLLELHIESQHHDLEQLRKKIEDVTPKR